MFAIVHSLVLLRDSHNILYVMSMTFIPLTFIYAGIGYYAVSEIQCYIYITYKCSNSLPHHRTLWSSFCGGVSESTESEVHWQDSLFGIRFFCLFHNQDKKDYMFLTFLHFFNPLHPIISMHILHTVLCTFPKVLTRRICLSIKSLFNWWSFPIVRRIRW